MLEFELRLRRVLLAGLAVTFSVLCVACDENGSPHESTHPDRVAEAELQAAFLQDVAECVSAAGIPMYKDPSGESYRVDHGGSVEEYRRLQEECVTQLGGWPAVAPVTIDELRQLYALEVAAYDCLLEHGYKPVPPSSVEDFVARYESGEAWYAHQSPIQGEVIPDTECPQPDFVDITW